MRKFMLAFAVSGLALATSAFGAEVRSTDVIDFFLKSADLGAARGICVGTAQECAQEAKPAGFDVLVTFELNSATLTRAAVDNLEEVAKALVDPRLSGAKFAVEGHTDASGSDVYNQDLATRRANSVASFLVAQGVPNERLLAIGLGESAPRVADPFDPANRRVEMRINIQ